jgi:hypothetical protein
MAVQWGRLAAHDRDARNQAGSGGQRGIGRCSRSCQAGAASDPGRAPLDAREGEQPPRADGQGTTAQAPDRFAAIASP